jgi:hypothetical protein
MAPSMTPWPTFETTPTSTDPPARASRHEKVSQACRAGEGPYVQRARSRVDHCDDVCLWVTDLSSTYWHVHGGM